MVKKCNATEIQPRDNMYIGEREKHQIYNIVLQYTDKTTRIRATNVHLSLSVVIIIIIML